MSKSLLLALNKLFKPVEHPFNSMSAGGRTYSQWQYDNGARTVEFFTAKYSEQDMFVGKKVLDLGCGAAGKSLYYANAGGDVTGLDVFDDYKPQAEAFAEKLGLQNRFKFVAGDAAAMPFNGGSFDTIVANDAFEHIGDPGGALLECLRVLKPGGRLYINFPPYYHPMGAHLTDAIHIPWVQLFFRDNTLIAAYKQLVTNLPDGAARLKLRISKDEAGKEYFSYINKMTIRKFDALLQHAGVTPEYYHQAPLRKFLSPLAKVPVLKEMFVKMVVCVIRK